MGYVKINNHKSHVFTAGDQSKPKLVFMSGSGKAILENAKIVDSSGWIDCPIMMFVSNGKQVSSGWIYHERQFAEGMNAKTVYLNCGHYIHYYESKRISREIKVFVNQIME